MSLYESGDSSGNVSLDERREGHFTEGYVHDVELAAIVEFKNGDYAAFEIKLSDGGIHDAIASLTRFCSRVERKPVYMCIIVGHLNAVMRNPESGIFIVLLTSLRP